jgi:hypothetical protein
VSAVTDVPEIVPPKEVYVPFAVAAVPTSVILLIAIALSNFTIAPVTDVPVQSICQCSVVERMTPEPPEPLLYACTVATGAVPVTDESVNG